MKISCDEIDDILFGIGVDSFNRFQIFLNIAPHLKGKKYWHALRNSYDASDNLFPYARLVRASYLRAEPGRQFLMDSGERNYLKRLPEQITIYRGMTELELEQKSFGVSWSLKKEVAEFFANTYQRNHATNHLKKTVHEITINKNEVVAFLNGREEFEIIYINAPVQADYDKMKFFTPRTISGTETFAQALNGITCADN